MIQDTSTPYACCRFSDGEGKGHVRYIPLSLNGSGSSTATSFFSPIFFHFLLSQYYPFFLSSGLSKLHSFPPPKKDATGGRD